MINKNNITKLLDRLGEELAKNSLNRTITVFGSGALLLLDVSDNNRATHDIDIADPSMDMDLQLASFEVAKNSGLEIDWLNSAGTIFTSKLKPGWRKRIVAVYKSKNLTVNSLSEFDLICSKSYALATRGLDSDLTDLRALKPTKTDIKKVLEWVKTFDENQDISKRLLTLLENL